MRSATWEGIAGPDGSIGGDTYEIYDELAAGGVGTVITGFTSVALNDHYFNGMMRLCSDDLIPQYHKLTDIIHGHGAAVISQLALGAYYRNTNDYYRGLQVEPDGMTQDEIRLVINQFADAASRAERAGFDGVQIHAAHFFFLSRFISPAVNHRNDEYGGALERRSRILVEILNKIKSAAPGLHVTIKLNSNDFTRGGIDGEDFIGNCKLLDDAGIDLSLIHI